MAHEQALPETFPYFKDAEGMGVDDPWQKAYQTCLRYEAQATSHVGHVRARVLGYLIRKAPYDASRDGLCREINGATGRRAGFEIWRMCVSGLSLTARLGHQHHVHLDVREQDLKPRTTYREQALQRDNHRCIVTGAYAVEMYADGPDQDIALSAPLEVTHILPRSMPDDDDGMATSQGKVAEPELWSVMQRFGKISAEESSGDRVHRLENVMTLWDTVRALFYQLKVWFEPSDDDPYTCTVKTSFPRQGMPFLPPSFSMTSTDPRLPRPSPDYLRLHAACARVAHLSGAGAYVGAMYRASEDRGVLAQDGSSAMALHAMLSVLGRDSTV